MKTPTLSRTLPLLLSGLLASALTGCGSPQEEEPVESHSAALSTVDYFDHKSNFRVRITTCDWVGPAAHNTTSCSVGDDFLLIGGGAEVEGSTPNALLFGSFPVNLATWMAGSKDHSVSSPHRLRAYAIGLQVFGMTGANLRAQAKFVISSTSSPANHPTITQAVPPPGPGPTGYWITGGGAWDTWSGPGALLTESYPIPGAAAFDWKGSAKDHILAEQTHITVTAVGLPFCPVRDNGTQFCMNLRSDDASHFVNTGFGNASVGTPAGWVPAGVGGKAEFAGQGRLLTKMVPFTAAGGTGGWIQSKDHVRADSGFTHARILSIRSL